MAAFSNSEFLSYKIVFESLYRWSLDNYFDLYFDAFHGKTQYFFELEVVDMLVADNYKFRSVEVAPKTIALITAVAQSAKQVFRAVVCSCLRVAQATRIIP